MHFTSGKAVIGLTATLLGLATVSCVLIAQARENTNFNGVYMGLAAGGLNTSTDLSTASDYTLDTNQYIGPEHISSDTHKDASSTSTVWAGKLGYGTNVYNSIAWLGIEIFGNLANREAEDHSFESTINREFAPSVAVANQTEMTLNNGEYGIDFRPGVLLTPTSLLYARIGAAFNVLRLNSVTDGFSPQDPEFLPLSLNLEESEHVTGLRLGIGFEQKMNCQFSFSADYIYTDYGDINVFGRTSAVFIKETARQQPFASANLTSSADADSIKTNAVMLGFNYYPNANDCN